MGVSSNNFELFKMLTVNWGIGRSSSDIELTSAQYIIAAKKYAEIETDSWWKITENVAGQAHAKYPVKMNDNHDKKSI